MSERERERGEKERESERREGGRKRGRQEEREGERERGREGEGVRIVTVTRLTQITQAIFASVRARASGTQQHLKTNLLH